MALMSSAARSKFESYLGIVKEEVRSGVTNAYTKRKDSHWTIWVEYCEQSHLDPFLRGTTDPIPFLQVFAAQYRDGSIAPSKKSVRSKTVSDAVRSVGQKFSGLGSTDPRYDVYGKIDFRLSRQYRSYTKKDSPPVRVKPVPITLIIRALQFALITGPTAERIAVAHMICIAFFFCLRPGEYTGTTTDDQAFSLADISFHLGDRKLNNASSPEHEILAATAVKYIFTTQKNGDKGVVIAHARSGDNICCPVLSTIQLFLIHRREFCRKNVPYDGKLKLASYYNSKQKNVPVKAKQVTDALRWHAAILQPVTGIDPNDVSARSLRAGGAMALLAGNCDSSIIKLLARWHSDAMMDYLHQQSLPIFKRLAATMFNHGSYSFLPDEWVPSNAIAID
jgi:hypothetical protein